jgi:hypothetical protein
MEDIKIAKPLPGFIEQFAGNFSDVEIRLIFEFFMVYSRFEFTLKQFKEFRKKDSRAVANWPAFANAIQAKFFPSQSSELMEAYEYYLKYPPGVQIVRNGHLAWKANEKKENETEFAWVIRSIGTVRNNLFHGGKFPWDYIRDTTLLSNGLIILHACLRLNGKVLNEFYSSMTLIPIEWRISKE